MKRQELVWLRCREWIMAALVLLSALATGAAMAQSPGRPASPAVADEAWRNAPPTSTGIPVGEKIPPFSVPDQNGKAQTFDSIKGPHGAAIYFMRSADW